MNTFDLLVALTTSGAPKSSPPTGRRSSGRRYIGIRSRQHRQDAGRPPTLATSCPFEAVWPRMQSGKKLSSRSGHRLPGKPCRACAIEAEQ
jgi:hypothetical protein